MKYFWIFLIIIIFLYRFPFESPHYNGLIKGTVASLPIHYTHSLDFLFIPKNSHQAITINWYYPPPVTLRPGDEWELYLLTNKNTQKTAVKMNYKNQLYLPHVKSYPLQTIRQKIYKNIQQTLNNKPYLGFISALTVGIRDNITQNQWQDLRNTGTNHLMAIAGLHIGFMFGFIFYLSNLLWRRSEKLMLFKPAQEACLIIGFLGALFYGALSGFAIPAQRAIIMLAVFVFTTLSRRKTNILKSYFIALLLVLAWEPYSVLTPTFWLSFTAVGLLIYGNGGRVGKMGWWWHWTRAQWVMAVGLIPLSLFFFQQVSFIGVLTNMIAIPFVGFIILPLCLLGILFHPLWTLANALFTLFWPLMHKLATLPHSQYHQELTHPFLLFPLFIGILLLLAPRGFPARWLGFIWLLVLIR